MARETLIGTRTALGHGFGSKLPASEIPDPSVLKSQIRRPWRRIGFVLHYLEVLSYDSPVAVKWADSADKRGIDHRDTLNAIASAAYAVQGFGESRVQSRGRVDLYIGPTRDGQTVLEVMTETIGRDVVIFHVMPVRQKILDAAREQSREGR